MQAILRRAMFAFVAAMTTTGAIAACHPAPHSNLGCEFYAVTLPNSLADPSLNFGVRVLNPSSSTTANLQVSGGGLATPLDIPVSPGAETAQALPWVTLVSSATDTALVAGGAYHLVSDAPLSVLQLNPDSNSSQSSDATLLVSVQNAGTSFMTNVWPEWDSGAGFQLPAQLCVVATQASTTVQISGQNLQSGAGLTSTGGSVLMDAGDVLMLSSTLSTSIDISGTQIASSAPVIVFSTHAGTFVPSNIGYGDHLEDLVPPISELGMDYLLLRPSDPSGGNGAKQYVKLTGTADNTNLIFDPNFSGAPSTLNAGASYAFEATADVHVSADHPIVVSQFMEGSAAFAGNVNNLGDPSQLTSIPSNRGALAIDFIAPTVLASIYAQVVAPTGTTVTLDGSTVTGWQAIGSSGFSGSNVLLCCTDVHHASAAQPFTLSVYSYPTGSSTSFWYAGGLGPSDDVFGDDFE